jgi:predicted RNA-binding Zn ribbon-like protein
MAEDFEPIETVELLGGALALDFANTASERGETLRERLRSYHDLVTWSERVGEIGAAEAKRLREVASGNPRRAELVRQRAVELRETMHRIFSALARGGQAAASDLAELSGAVAEAATHRRLVAEGSGLTWQWEEGREPLERLLWPPVQSAVDLLTGGELDRVKMCDNDPCSWLFLDSSRNRSRRWCDMKDCGNRAKARRHYARRKAQQN